MRSAAIAFCTLIGSLGLAGSAAAHTMTIQFPGGATETIEYTGAAPKIVVGPAPTRAAFDEAPFGAFAPDPIFAAMERQSAAMERQAAAMLNAVDALASQSFAHLSPAIPVDARNLPAGTESYSFVATLSPDGTCSQSMEIIAAGPGNQPRVIRRSAGDCRGMANIAAPQTGPALAPPHQRVETYQIDARPARPAQAMLREAAWRE